MEWTCDVNNPQCISQDHWWSLSLKSDSQRAPINVVRVRAHQKGSSIYEKLWSKFLLVQVDVVWINGSCVTSVLTWALSILGLVIAH